MSSVVTDSSARSQDGKRVVDHIGAIRSNNSPAWKAVVYDIERAIGHTFFRRRPPDRGTPRLLNLGCDSTKFYGWVNADHYRFIALIRQRHLRFDWMLDAEKPWSCADDYWDGIFTDHVLEHLSYQGVTVALHEAHRTLKPGAWIRISVPNLERYIRCEGSQFAHFIDPAEAVSHLAQNHNHRSLWTPSLMQRLLLGLNYADVREVEFGEGSDPRLLRDATERQELSFYVEARKPLLE